MTADPYAALDPDVAGALRAIFEHEIEQRVRPMREAEEDRKVREHVRDLSAKYKDFGPKQREIMQFAIDHNIGDLEIAYRAMRDPDAQPAAPAPTKPSDTTEATPTAQTARPVDPAFAGHREQQMLDDERASRRQSEDDAARQMFREANTKSGGDDDFRRQRLHDMNEESRIENELRTARAASGKIVDPGPRRGRDNRSTAEKYDEMDLRAVDLFRAANEGREEQHLASTQRTRSRSRAQREADTYGHDTADLALREAMTPTGATAEDIIRAASTE